MPKPWELDWSAGAPAPNTIPLPIVPFLGRPRAPMLDDGGVGIEPAAMPAAYGLAGGDPLAMQAARPPAGAAADPAVMQAPSRSSALAATTFGMPITAPLQALATEASAFQPPVPPAGPEADQLAHMPQPFGSAGRSTADPTAAVGADRTALLQPAVYEAWNGLAGQSGTSSPPGQAEAVPPALRLAGQDTLQTYGFPGRPQPWERRADPQLPINNGSLLPAAPHAGGALTAIARPGSAGTVRPPQVVSGGDRIVDPLKAEYAYQININRIVKSAKPNAPALIQKYASQAGRPVNDDAVNRLVQIAGRNDKIGDLWTGQVLSYAQRGARLRDRLVLIGLNPRAASAMAANAMVESLGYYRRSQQGGGNGYGLWQWNPERRANFERHMGIRFSDATEDQQIGFMLWEMQNIPQFKPVWTALNSNQSAGDMAKTAAADYEIMREKKNNPIQRAAIAEVLSAIPFDSTRNPEAPTRPPPEVEAYLRHRTRR